MSNSLTSFFDCCSLYLVGTSEPSGALPSPTWTRRTGFCSAPTSRRSERTVENPAGRPCNGTPSSTVSTPASPAASLKARICPDPGGQRAVCNPSCLASSRLRSWPERQSGQRSRLGRAMTAPRRDQSDVITTMAMTRTNTDLSKSFSLKLHKVLDSYASCGVGGIYLLSKKKGWK